MFTRQHYQAIASIIADSHNELAATRVLSPTQYIAHRLANYFAADNPRFDRARFLKACGIAE